MTPDRTRTGIGCIAILPAALVGAAGLADGIGPTGWRGFAEMFGWMITCAATAGLLSSILRRRRRTGWGGHTLATAIVILTGWGAYCLMNWLGLDAPMAAKTGFTSGMQLLGSLAMPTGFALLALYWWRGGRHY